MTLMTGTSSFNIVKSIKAESGKISPFLLIKLVPIFHCSNLCSTGEKPQAQPSTLGLSPIKKSLKQNINIFGSSTTFINDIFLYLFKEKSFTSYGKKIFACGGVRAPSRGKIFSDPEISIQMTKIEGGNFLIQELHWSMNRPNVRNCLQIFEEIVENYFGVTSQ